MIEGTGHRVLTADGCQTKAELCIKGTEQCRKRLTPA